MVVSDNFIQEMKNGEWHTIIIKVPYNDVSEKFLLRFDGEVEKYLVYEDNVCKNPINTKVDQNDINLRDCEKYIPQNIPVSVRDWITKYTPQLRIEPCKTPGWYNNYNTFGVTGLKSTKERKKIKIFYKDQDFDKYISVYTLITSELKKNSIAYETACLYTPE